MNTLGLIHGLGSAGPFASRAFLPVLVVALLVRFKDLVPIDRIQALEAPEWFTHPATLATLLALVILEHLANRSEDLREYVNDADKYVKAGAAALTSLGLLSAADAAFVSGAVQHASVTPWLGALLAAGSTLAAAELRGQVWSVLGDNDPGDDTGLLKAGTWLEEGWAVLGIVLLVALPLVALALFATALGAMVLVRRAFERRERTRKRSCAGCGKPVFRSAVRCGASATPVAAPVAGGGPRRPDLLARAPAPALRSPPAVRARGHPALDDAAPAPPDGAPAAPRRSSARR